MGRRQRTAVGRFSMPATNYVKREGKAMTSNMITLKKRQKRLNLFADINRSFVNHTTGCVWSGEVGFVTGARVAGFYVFIKRWEWFNEMGIERIRNEVSVHNKAQLWPALTAFLVAINASCSVCIPKSSSPPTISPLPHPCGKPPRRLLPS